MRTKFLISVLLLMFAFYMEGQTNNLNKKWIVYSTVDSSLTGWHSFKDSYILDFSDSKNLIIKTLGEGELVEVPYYFNSENGVIYEENGEILYSVKKISSDKLVLAMDENSTTTVNLMAIPDVKLFDSNIIKLLINHKWKKDTNSVEFIDDMYMVVGKIETNFKTFIEKNETSKSEFKGAWLFDSYKGLCFLELYSEKFNHKSIYQILSISDTKITASSFDKEGKELLMELSTH